jgi:Polyketide cyclase / dehydrase and lipid transport
MPPGKVSPRNRNRTIRDPIATDNTPTAANLRQTVIKKLIVALALLLIALAVVIALQPADFRITRNTTIAAPAAVVFANVNDFRKWEAWSPWAKLDPSMKVAYDGPARGPGMIYTWSGNNKVGQGRMTIIESRPDDLVRIELEFLKPMAATNKTEFTFTPAGNQTAVNWTMTGTNNFFGKAFALFMNMDKMVGKDFENGLAQMKALLESAPKP